MKKLVFSVRFLIFVISGIYCWSVAAQEADSEELSLPVSINALMVTLIDHSAHYIWDYSSVLESRSLTDKEWQVVEYYSVQLAASGPLIKLGGTGVMDKQWVTTPGWKKWSTQLSDVAVSALQATRDHDKAGLIKANNDLVDVCEGCHKDFKPEVPTEGILHDPQYDHLYHLLSSE